MSSKNWIADATSNAHGQFAAKAKAAGMSTISFARKKKGAKGVTGKQARLAATLMGMNKKKPAMKMDAEDKMDGGADENKEQS